MAIYVYHANAFLTPCTFVKPLKTLSLLCLCGWYILLLHGEHWVRKWRKSEPKGHSVEMKDQIDPKMDKLRNHTGIHWCTKLIPLTVSYGGTWTPKCSGLWNSVKYGKAGWQGTCRAGEWTPALILGSVGHPAVCADYFGMPYKFCYLSLFIHLYNLQMISEQLRKHD